MVAKTPPGRPVPELAGADEAWVTAGAELAPAADDAPVAAAAATTAPQDGPVGATGVAVAKPNCSRESPGFGNFTSAESTLSQLEVGMFATNISGSALKAA